MKTTSTGQALSRLLFGASLAMLLPQASIAAIIYSEAVSGDIQGDQNTPALLGSFAVGTNSIVGRQSIASDTAPGQGDTFGFSLAVGQHIDSIVLRITNNANGADSFTTTVFQSPFTQVQQMLQSAGTVGDIHFNPFASQSPGQYNFSTQFATGNAPQNGFDWQWDIQVSGAPEPSSLALLGLAAGALGLSRRRRRPG